ncbi:MAG TPA: HAD family hydrolase [Kofleriaceae bacterium]
MRGPLESWRAGAAQRAILDFVVATTMPTSASYVRIEDRIAVFDHDGTLWCERPLPIYAQFLVRRLAAMAERDPELRARADALGLGDAIEGATVEELASAAVAFVRSAQHPDLHRVYAECTYRPMIALVRFLHANHFTTYLAAGGGRDFVRPLSQELYGIPPERVIGSSSDLELVDDDVAKLVHKRPPDLLDDGPAKPIQIWGRVGRRPILVAGNANGDIPMLRYAAHPSRPSLGLLVDHDDDKRDIAYRDGADEALRLASRHGWIVVSIKDDWADVMSASGNGGNGDRRG